MKSNKDLIVKKLNDQLKTAKTESVKQALRNRLAELKSDKPIEK